MYFRYMRIHIKGVLEYRGSFWLSLTGQFLTTFLSFIGMMLLFERFGRIGQWSYGESALCFAISGLSFALAECFMRGFDAFSRLVARGDFDRLLVRPRGTVIQVMGSAVDFTRLGRILQSLIALCYALTLTDIIWSPLNVFVLCSMILSGATVFSGVFILGAAFSFVTIEGMELVNLLSDGGREVCRYPLDIYAKWFSRVFTFVVPYAMFNLYPLMLLTGRAQGFLYICAPWQGVLFLIPCLLVWRAGVRSYLSTGN